MGKKSDNHFVQDSGEGIRSLNEQTETVHSSPTMSLNDFLAKAKPTLNNTTPPAETNSTNRIP